MAARSSFASTVFTTVGDQDAFEDQNERAVQPRDQCTYTKCYCEENVWKMLEQLCKNDNDGTEPPSNVLDPYYVVFISNRHQAVLLFQQGAGQPPDGRCIWDYHVILVGKQLGKTSLFVRDFSLLILIFIL